MTNSLKFSKRAPQIFIKSRMVDGEAVSHLSLSPGDHLELQFSDNGIGFEQQYADKAFSIFQRLHTQPHYTGTGIGLALCKKIVENHDGKITVQSEPGKGTTFYIYIPAQYVLSDKKEVNTATEAMKQKRIS